MADFITDLKRKFKNGNIALKFIYANIALFILTSLIVIFWTLFNREGNYLLLYLELPASLNRFLYQPWSIITYMFMHANLLHILFNMLWLYWFGELFLYFFSSRHLRGLYFLGGIAGGILYMIAYNVFPYFMAVVNQSYLLGASASVLAIVVATAAKSPNYSVTLLFFGRVRLKYLAAIIVLLDLLFITSDNAGGHIAHLGGALAGWIFVVGLNSGHDYTKWINQFIDIFSKIDFSRKRRKPKMKVYYGERSKDYDYNARKKQNNDEIDRILDKLKKSGYDSLTTSEKKALFDASNK